VEAAEREIERLRKAVIPAEKKKETYFPGAKVMYKTAEKKHV